MSWDIFAQNLPPGAASIDDIPDDYLPPAIGSRESIIRAIQQAVPTADFSDPAWGLIDGPEFSIEVSLGEEEHLKGFALHVRGDETAIPIIVGILQSTGLRALDSSSGDIFSEESATASLRKWRKYRDQVVGNENGG